MHKALLLSFIAIVIASFSIAQPPVDVWQVQTPSNPLNCTSTTITVTGWNDAVNYTLQTITHSYGNDTIWVEIPYVSPQIVLGALTSWSHTISLGNVPYGNWTVAARGYLGGVWQSEAYGWLPVDACCPSSIPQFDFVEDTVCANSSISVTNNSTGNNLTYLWEYEGGSSTAASPTFSIAEAGTWDVTLTVTGDSCSDSLVKAIEVLAQPELELGNDTTVCSGDTLTLTLPAGNDYLWSDGSTSHENAIASLSSLAVTVTNDDGCISSDTISVTAVLPKVSVNLGADKQVCPNDEVILNAGSGGSTYAWSNGDSTQSITVNQDGVISVTVSESGSCDGFDEILIDWHNIDMVEIELSDDSCAQRMISVDPNSHDVISWSNSTVDTSTAVTMPGYYSVTATDNNGCESIDSSWVNIVDNPIVDLGADTFLCGNQTITLTTGLSGSHLWKDGSTGIAFTVTKKGKYSVSVTDEFGCSGADTIKVDDCLFVGETERSGVKIYPIPAMNYIKLEHSANEVFQIYDASGKMVLKGNMLDDVINIENLEGGLYFLTVGEIEGRAQSFIKH